MIDNHSYTLVSGCKSESSSSTIVIATGDVDTGQLPHMGHANASVGLEQRSHDPTGQGRPL